MKFETKEIENSLGDYDFPKVIVVETTAYCNLKCTICPQKSMLRKKGSMSFNTFKRIADEVGDKDTSLWLALMGEPLVQPNNLIRMIKYTKSQKIRQVSLNTNGMLLTPTVSKELVKSGLDKVILSIDGFKSDTYEAIRVGGNYQRLMEKVNDLIVMNKSYDSPIEIIVQFIITESNEDEVEVEDFKTFWLSKGVTVKIRPKLSWGHAIEAKNQTLTQNDRTYPCPWLMRTVIVHWNGDFAQCDADFEAQYIAGNINSKSIKEVWDGDLKNRRDKHWKGDFSHPLCRECRDWQVGRSLFYGGTE